jgi:hypothetical protein
MKKLILTIKENWKDPVWSKVIATGIISVSGFILTALYSLIISLFIKISFADALNEVGTFLNKNIDLKVWSIIALSVLYLILVFNQFTSLIKNIFIKLKSPRTKTKKPAEPEAPRATEHSTSLFYQRMASAFPGIREVTWIENPKDATNRLEILLRKPLRFKSDLREFESDPIWWFRGSSAADIERFKRIGRRGILMNFDQLKIRRIAAYHGGSYYKDFVYVEVEGEKQTGLYNLKEEDIQKNIDKFGYCWEEYGLIKNKLGWKTPIRRENFDDGATVIRGKVRDTMNAELRVRYISKYNFIIAAKGSPYNSHKFDRNSDDYLNDILKGKVDPNKFFEFLKEFKKQEQ